MIGIILIVVHLLEYLVLKTVVKTLEISFVQTMIFGYGYWLTMVMERRKST